MSYLDSDFEVNLKILFYILCMYLGFMRKVVIKS